MWRWGIPALSPSRSISFCAPSIDRGAPRSLTNRKRDSPLSRKTARIRRISSPSSPWIPEVPFFALETCRDALFKSMWSTCRETNSDTRSACLKVRRTRSLSRLGLRDLPATINSLAISSSVRYSRTEDEIAKLLIVAGKSRNPNRDKLLVLLTFRHALRVSELVSLQVDHIDLKSA